MSYRLGPEVLLLDGAGPFQDTSDPSVLWELPGELTVRSDADGTPRFLLSRWRDPVAEDAQLVLSETLRHSVLQVVHS